MGAAEASAAVKIARLIRAAKAGCKAVFAMASAARARPGGLVRRDAGPL